VIGLFCRIDGHDTERSAASTSLLSNVDISASLDFDPHDVGLSAALLDSSVDDAAMTDRRFSNLEATNLTSRADPRHTARNHVTGEARSASALPAVPATLNLEPLQPARLCPAKEKTNSDSKALESGEAGSKCRADDDANNASDASTPSDSYQTPGGSPQREAASLSDRLTYDMTVSSGPDPSSSYVVHSTNLKDFVHDDNADSNKLQMSGTEKPVLQSVLKSSTDSNERTSFAKLRKWKERNAGSLESPVIYDQRGSQTMSKSVYVVPPAQTTWMEAARIQRSASDRQVCRPVAELSDGGLAPSQMAGLRMRLEEKRRLIQSGKQRVELQRNQQQQQVGEEAFVQMIRRKDRQPDTSLLAKNMSPLSASNVRSASAGRYPTAADSKIMRQQGQGKDTAVLRPPTQPVLSGATMSKTRDSTKVTNSQTVAGGTPTITRPSPAVTQQSDVVDGVSQNNKHQTRPSATLQAPPPDKTNQLEPPQGMSFDRLSTSLSDLQAEIVRLTQQQDEIKHLVSGGGGANGTTPAEHTPFFLYPTTGQAVSTAPSAIQTAPPTGTIIPPASTQPPHAYPPPSAYPVDPRLYVPEYGTYPPHYSTHHHHIASSLPPAGAMYPVSGMPPLTHRYPGGGPYMAPYPHDPMSGMYRSPGMPPTAASDVYPMHWPHIQDPQSYFMSSPYVDHSRGHNIPVGVAAPSVLPHAVSMPGHSSREPTAVPHTTVVSGSVVSQSHVAHDVRVRNMPTSPSITSPSEALSPASVTSPAATTPTPVTQATAFFVDTSKTAAAVDTSPEPPHSSPATSSVLSPALLVSTSQPTAFFVSTSPSVDSASPKSHEEPEVSVESEEQPDTASVVESQKNTELQPPSVTEELTETDVTTAAVLPPPDVAVASTAESKVPAVVFVIGQDEEV